MFKKTVVLVGTLTILSLVLALPVSAETKTKKCGFWARVFWQCDDKYPQLANVNGADFSSTTKEGRPINMKLASSSASISASQIQCVGSAVAVREGSLVSGMSAYTQSINSAYSTRASELATAYSKTTMPELRAGISVAWKNFNTNTKNAKKTWQTVKETAWKTFKTAVKACGATESVSDSANVVTEMSGS